MIKLAVFVSGRGSNLKSIIHRIEDGELDAEIVAVVSNKLECPALKYSSEKKIRTFVVNETDFSDSVSYSDLQKKFTALKIDLIVLAGYLKKIPDYFVDSFVNKIINIHPALLPSFGGKGMYGMNVHRAVFNSSAKVSGATVHFVNKVYDDGFIISQRSIDISDADSPDEIAKRVLKVEHELLPNTIDLFAKNKIKIHENRVVYV